MALRRLMVSRGSSEAVVRLECAGDEIVVSPPLRPGGPCEPCWRRRRAATLDPATLPSSDVEGRPLVEAFDGWIAASDHVHGSAARIAAARFVRACLREARLSHAARVPQRLWRVTADARVLDEPVLALPDCAECRAAASPSTQQRLNHLLGTAAGIVTALAEVPARRGEPAWPRVVVATLANTWLRPDWAFGKGASGRGDTLEIAVASAIGEAIERYAASVAALPCRSARADDMADAVHPRRLTGLDDACARAAGLDPDREIAWVCAAAMGRRFTQRWLPASAVYLDDARTVGEHRGTVPTSNGLASAHDLATALRRAYAEVVERHLFFLVWYGAKDPDLEDARDLVKASARAVFEAAELHLAASLLGQEGRICVASASCWPRCASPARPAFALGLGTGRCAEDAVGAAVLELGQVYRGLTWALADPDLSARARRLAVNPAAVSDPFDHALLYATRPPVAPPVPFGPAARQVRARFAGAAGIEAWALDLTPPDILDATGWRVARVVVPDRLPLHFGMMGIPRAMLEFEGEPSPDAELLHPLS